MAETMVTTSGKSRTTVFRSRRRRPWKFPLETVCLAIAATVLMLHSIIDDIFRNGGGGGGVVDAARTSRNRSPSGFYADNGIDQTVVYEQMSKRERREMQQEILSLLGLHHRPRPIARGTDNSAPKYMINLYRSFVVDQTDELPPMTNFNLLNLMHDQKEDDHDRAVDGSGIGIGLNGTGRPALLDSKRAIGDADVIMSFVNHGLLRMRKCRRPKLARVQSQPATCDRNYGRKDGRNYTGHRLAHFRHEKDKRFWFDLSEVPAEETIIEAELRLFKEARPTPTPTPPSNQSDSDGGPRDDQYIVALFKVVQGSDPEDKELHYLDSVNVSAKQSGWIKLNATSAAGDWVVFPGKNLGLYLRIEAHGHAREYQPKDVGIVGQKGAADRQPFMVAFFRTSHELHVRRTRAAQRKQSLADTSYAAAAGNAYGLNSYMHFDPNYARRSCQTRTLYVNFKDLGWQDWIIAPDGYAAFYCQGECSFPLNTNMNATNHAIVQTLVNLMKPETVPKPCCAPSKLSHISVLYYDDNSNVILKKYRNMVVRACGCH